MRTRCIVRHHACCSPMARKIPGEDYTTAYQNDFRGCMPEKLQSCKPNACTDQKYIACREKRQPCDNPTYKADYTCHTVQPRTRCIIKGACCPLKARKIPVVDYTTVYQNDYRGCMPKKLQSCKPEQKNFGCKEKRPFDDTTTYKADYIPHPMQPRTKCIVRPDCYPQRKPGVDYTTVYQNDYRGWKPKKLQSCKPEQKNYGCKEKRPFDGTTTYKADYIPHPMQPRTRCIIKPPCHPLKKPGVDYTTVYQNDYRGWKPKKVQSFKPEQKYFGCKEKRAPFDGTTTYKADYTSHPLQPRTKYITKQACHSQRKPVVDYTTVYQNDYRGWMPKKVQSCKPEQKSYGCRPPFDGTTTYKTDYIPHPLPPRCKKPTPVICCCEVQSVPPSGQQECFDYIQQIDPCSNTENLNPPACTTFHTIPCHDHPKCDCMENYQNPAETVGCFAFECPSGMSLVGERNCCP